MPGGNAVKIGIIVACLAAAVIVYAVTNRESVPQSAAKSETNLVCTKCKAHFTMPLAEYEKAVRAAAAQQPEPTETGGPRVSRGALKPIVVKCSKCGEDAAVTAMKCPNSDTWYPAKNLDGTPGKCPD